MKWKLTLAMADGTEITIEGEFAEQLRAAIGGLAELMERAKEDR